MRGRRDPLGRGITNRWTGARAAKLSARGFMVIKFVRARSTQPFDGFFMIRVLKHLLFVVIAVVGGYAVTLLCYMVGLVQPSLYLARLVAEDRGGDTLLVPFLVINTGLSAVGIYLILWFVTRKRRLGPA